MTAAPDILATLLTPLTPTQFFAEHWKKKALYLSGGAERGKSLGVTVDSVFAAIRSRSDRPVKAQFFDDNGEHREFVLPSGSPELALNLLKSGMTLCISNFDRMSDSVGQMSRALAESLAIPGLLDVQLYMSGRGRGFGLHFDETPVCVLQCQGSKRWLYGATPAVPEPPSNLVGEHRSVVAFLRDATDTRLELPLQGELTESTLSPGDLLFLPAGTWHRAYGADDVSVAVTFGFSPRRLVMGLTSAVAQLIERAVPFTPDLDRSHAGEPADMRSWVRASLPSLCRKLESFTPAQVDQIVEALEKSAGRSPAPPRGEQPRSAEPLAPEAWADGTTFVVREPATAVFTGPDSDGERALFVYRGDEGVQLPSSFRSIVERLLAKREFTMAEARTLLPRDEDRRTILEQLSEVGAIVPVE